MPDCKTETPAFEREGGRFRPQAKVGEERVQKAIVRMKPIVSHEELATEFKNKQPEVRKQILNDSVKILLKGRSVSDRDAIPERE